MSWKAPRIASTVPAGLSTGSAKTRICRTLPSSARTIRNVAPVGSRACRSVSLNRLTAGTSIAVT